MKRIDVNVTGLPTTIATVHIVRYDFAAHRWVMNTPAIPVAAGSVAIDISNPESPISNPWSYAIVVADEGDPIVAVPAAEEPLTGVAPVSLPLTATSAGVLSPASLPPSGGVAVGTLGIESPEPLPSGTIVQTNIKETFTLSSGAVASEEQRSQDLVLYRAPAAPVAPNAPIAPLAPDAPVAPGRLYAEFPVTPSRVFTPTELVEGRVHLDVLAGREAVRGRTGGSEAVTVDAGSSRIVVPPNALVADTAIAVQPTILSAFLPVAAGVDPLGEVMVDLSGQTLTVGAELSISALQGFNPPLSAGDKFLAARVERPEGIPRFVVAATAQVVGDRIVTMAHSALPGIVRGGRYVFYRVAVPFGFVTGVTSTSTGTSVPGTIVEAPGLPFSGLADANGTYTLPAGVGAVTASARLPRTALVASATTAVTNGATATLHLTLSGVVTSATVTPPNGSVAVAVSSQVEILTSAALDAASVNPATIQIVPVPDGPCVPATICAPVGIRVVLSGSGRTLAVVPTAQLAAGAAYRLDVTGLRDVFGGVVLVPASTFRTAENTPLVVDAKRVVFSMPDANRSVTVSAPAGALPPGSALTVVNATNGEVASFTVGNDGSLTGTITATIDDEQIVTITDPQGRVTTFTRGMYRAPDGTTAVNSAGGVIEDESGIEVRIPEAALDHGLRLTLEALTVDAFPTLPTLRGANFGQGLKVSASEATHFEKEVDLAFPVPAGAPANPKDAFYHVYRRLQGPSGQVLFESVDDAFVEGEGANAKVVTASFPMYGYRHGFNAFDAQHQLRVSAFDAGVPGTMMTAHMVMLWTHNALMPGAPVSGKITGRVVRPRFVEGSGIPVFEGVPGLIVQKDNDPNAPVGVTQPDGRFTFDDPTFTSGAITIRTEYLNAEFEATTFAVARTDSKVATDPALGALVAQGHFTNLATANITLPAADVAPPAPQVTIRVMRLEGGARKSTDGIVVAGTPLVIGFATDGRINSAMIQGEPYSVQVDPLQGQNSALGMDSIVEYTASTPGSYTISVTALPPFGPPVTATGSFRVIAAGGSQLTSVPGRPGVILARMVPKANATSVPVTIFPQVTFTEPVTQISSASVQLIGPDGVVPVKLLAVAVDSGGNPYPVDDLQDPNVVVSSLTLQPTIGLRFGGAYRIVLTDAIVDRDTPAPQPLTPFESRFTTFTPEDLSNENDEAPRGSGLVVLGDRAYLAETEYPGGIGSPAVQTGRLRTYDVSDPVTPVEIPPSVSIGYAPRDIAGEDRGDQRTLVVATSPKAYFFAEGEQIFTSTIQSSPSTLFVYDATNEPARWVGAATITGGLEDGVPNRVVVKDGLAYVATVGKGVQVVDLSQARAGFAFEGYAPNAAGPELFNLRRQIFSGGINHGALIATVPVGPGGGSEFSYPLADLKVADLIVGETGRRLVLATGPRPAVGLVVLDPLSGEKLWRSELLKDGKRLEHGSAVAFATIDGRPVAVVGGTGLATGGSSGMLFFVDLSPLALLPQQAPTVMSALGLTHQVGDILIKDGIAIVSASAGAGAGAATLMDLTELMAPRVVGTLSGIASRMAMAEGILYSTERGFLIGAPTQLGGVQTAALNTLGIIRRVTASPIVYTSSTSVSERAVDIDVAIVPSGEAIESAVVHILRDGVLVDSLPAAVTGSTAKAIWPAGREIVRGARYAAEAVITRQDAQPLETVPAYMPLVDVVLVDKRGEEVMVPPTSNPRPVIELDALTTGNIAIRPDSLQAEIRLAGTVRDDVADIVADQAADIREVLINGVRATVTRMPESPTPARPHAFRGRFTATATIDLVDGPNTVSVEAVNSVGNYGYDSATVNVRQVLPEIVVPSNGTLYSPKALDPFTLVTTPTAPDRIDTLVLYHGSQAPTGNETALTETGESTGIFAGLTADLGAVTVTLQTPFTANNPAQEENIRAVVSSTGLAMVEDELEFLEEGPSAGIFRTVARRLPNNLSMEVHVPTAPTPEVVDTLRVRTGAMSDAEAVTMTETAPNSRIFTGAVPGLGTTIDLRSIETAVGGTGLVRFNLSASELNLTGFRMELSETGVGTDRYMTEPYEVSNQPVEPLLPAPTSTTIVGIQNNPPSSSGVFEPVWVVARGMASAAVGDTAQINGESFDLTNAPLPVTPTMSSAVPRTVRVAQPILFVNEPTIAPIKNVRIAKAIPTGSATDVTPREHGIIVRSDRENLTFRRTISSVGLSRTVAVRGSKTRIVASFVTESVLARNVATVCAGAGSDPCASGEIQIGMSDYQVARAGQKSTFTVTLDLSVPRTSSTGLRPLAFRFNDGKTELFRDAVDIQPARVVVLAIDGLSKELFDQAVAMPVSGNSPPPLNEREQRTGLNYIFSKMPEQSIIREQSTTFPPITYSRWTTIFSGKTPSETKVPALQWLNREAFRIGEGAAGAVNQGLGRGDARLANFVASDGAAFNSKPQVPFVYDELRRKGLRSGVFLQQAGLGKSDSGIADDVWDMSRSGVVLRVPFSGVSKALDDAAIALATGNWSRKGAFDLNVIYLAGLDHDIHALGVPRGPEYFREFLHGRINGIVTDLKRRGWLESTVFAVMSDHGHVDTNPIKSVDLDAVGLFISTSTLHPKSARAVIGDTSRKLRIGDQYQTGVSGPNVIFVPQFGLANIYVAGNVSSGEEPDWRTPASLSALEPIVNRLITAYVQTSPTLKVVSKILVRVPGPDGGFKGSTYMVVPDTYRIGEGSLASQLVSASTLIGQSLEGQAGWEFNDPEHRLNGVVSGDGERVGGSISINSGDIVLLANLPDKFQFGKGYSAQHGSLTVKDSLVPLAFAYPDASGPAGTDDTMKTLFELFGGSEQRIMEPTEAEALRRFFH